MSVAFRAEGFNVLNTANFAVPGGGLGSSTFGVINAMSAAYNPRLFQFALKLIF